MSIFSLKDKVAVVTGGGSGIGAAISRVFAQQGATVCILDFSREGGDKIKGEIENTGGIAKVYQVNVADQKAVFEVFKKLESDFGKLDILVNNAGVAHVGNIENCPEEDFDRVYNVNVKGVYNTLKAGVELMVKNGKGAILNLASIANNVGIADRFAYSMSKGAVLTMTLSVAKDYVGKGIRCNCISPGRVHTPFVDNFIAKNYPGKEKEKFEELSKSSPIGRMAQPEEIAHIALYLCSDEAGFITGSNHDIDGGFSGTR